MNDIRGGRVTCYLDDIRPLRSFGEGQAARSGYMNRNIPLPLERQGEEGKEPKQKGQRGNSGTSRHFSDLRVRT